MSLGGTRSQTLDNVIDASINSRVTYTVAAGNNREEACLSSPGDDSRAIVVGASTETDARAEFSNWGSVSTSSLPATGSSRTTSAAEPRREWNVDGRSPRGRRRCALPRRHPLASVDEVDHRTGVHRDHRARDRHDGLAQRVLDTQDLTATAPLLPCTPVLEPPASGIGTVHLSWNTAVGAVLIEQFRIDRGTASERWRRTEPSREPCELRRSHRRRGDLVYRITALGGARGDSAPSDEVVERPPLPR